MTPRIAGFTYDRIEAGEVTLNVARAAPGRRSYCCTAPPQTHLAWRHVAADLAADQRRHLPRPARLRRQRQAPDDPQELAYARRTMAADIVALAHRLGHDWFALAGHDRGGRVAWRERQTFLVIKVGRV